MYPATRLLLLVLLLSGCRRSPATGSSDWSHPETATQYRACQEVRQKDPAAGLACLEATAGRDDAGDAPVNELISAYESGPHANPNRLLYWRNYRSRPRSVTTSAPPPPHVTHAEPPPHVSTPAHTSTPTHEYHAPSHTTSTPHVTSTPHATATPHHTTPTVHRSTPTRRH